MHNIPKRINNILSIINVYSETAHLPDSAEGATWLTSLCFFWLASFVISIQLHSTHQT